MAKQKQKKIQAVIKLQIPAGKATPAPPIGPALGQHGVNIMEFCKGYNEKTKDMGGLIVPVEILVFADKTFSFILKTPPATNLILRALGIEKGSGRPNTSFVGSISMAQIDEIVSIKMPDLNAMGLQSARRIIEGSARSMGVKVQG